MIEYIKRPRFCSWCITNVKLIVGEQRRGPDRDVVRDESQDQVHLLRRVLLTSSSSQFTHSLIRRQLLEQRRGSGKA